jgi:hypothetical protein
MTATPFPGESIDLDVDDPRKVRALDVAGTTPVVGDLDAEVARLRMVRRSPQSTTADRQGSVACLATYRDGLLLTLKFSGRDHWEVHSGDELIHILDGAATLDMVCDGGPPRSFALRKGTMAGR